MYKYFSDDLIEKFLFKNTIRFTQPSKFNDPFECSPVLGGISEREYLNEFIDEEKGVEIIKEFFKKSDFSFQENKIEEISRCYYNENKKMLMDLVYFDGNKISGSNLQDSVKLGVDIAIGVFCLSENYCDHLMWAHYANNHKGFLVKFNTDNDFFNKPRSSNDLCYRFEKVDYNEVRKKYNLIDLGSASILYEKDTCWGYEKEWRVAKPLSALKEVCDGVFISSFEWEIVDEIVFGVNCSDENKLKIRKHLNEVAPNVRLKEAILSREKYEITYENVK